MAHAIRPTRRTVLTCLTALLLTAPVLAEVRILPAVGRISEPFAVDFAPDGSAYGVEFTRGNRVFRFAKDGTLSFPAGFRHASDTKKSDAEAHDGPDPLKASFNGLHDLAITRAGRAILADTFNHRIRALDLATGAVSTLAGTGESGFGGDGGPATQAKFNQAYCGSLSPDQTALYVADLGNSRVRRIDLKTGTVSTVAGNGKRGAVVDGVNALESPLTGPRATVVAPDGTVYIVLREGHALVELKDGRLRTVVNVSGKPGTEGDGGPGREARLNGPKYLALDAAGAVLIVDTENHAIRRYDPASGRLTTVAGTLGKPGSGVGKALSDTPLKRPHGVRVAADGRWWISDSENHRIVIGTP